MFGSISHFKFIVCACALVALLSSRPAFADIYAPNSLATHSLQQAMASDEGFSLYDHGDKGGFNVGGSYFSAPLTGAADSIANYNNDDRLYALLIDGRYDFNYETSSLASPLHPYILGGMGMAAMNRDTLDQQGGSGMAPIFRLGGGVAYRLGQQWNMSLDYKAGFATATADDGVFTGRGQQPVDLQSLNLGMRYSF